MVPVKYHDDIADWQSHDNDEKVRRTCKEAPDETIWFYETEKIKDTTEHTSVTDTTENT